MHSESHTLSGRVWADAAEAGRALVSLDSDAAPRRRALRVQLGDSAKEVSRVQGTRDDVVRKSHRSASRRREIVVDNAVVGRTVISERAFLVEARKRQRGSVRPPRRPTVRLHVPVGRIVFGISRRGEW